MNKTNEVKIACITGAAGVMGTAIARSFHKDGVIVILADIDKVGVEKLAKEFQSNAYPVGIDISDPVEVNNIIEKVEKDVGSIDILINNAGILSNNKALTTSAEEWKRLLSVNIDGAFYLSKAVIPGMKKNKWGRIISVSSLAAKTGGLTAGIAYTVSKGALISLTFSLAAELAAFGITVNGIAPAYVNTPMVTEHLTESQRQELLEKIPVHRFCTPEEIAHVIQFLAHPLSGFITGEIIDQNGGLYFD